MEEFLNNGAVKMSFKLISHKSCCTAISKEFCSPEKKMQVTTWWKIQINFITKKFYYIIKIMWCECNG